jgi:drug/metabolite transporter (DMT)-like permease
MSRRAWVELLVLAALWGAVYPLIEIVLRDLSPVLVVLGRVVLAAALLVPLAVHRKALRPLWQRPRAIVETVLVQATIPLLLLTYGQEYVTAGVAGILIGAQPLFVALLALRYAPEERPRGWQGVLGILLGFAGLVLLFGVDLSGGWQGLLGGVLVLVAALGYGAGALMIHRRHADAQPLGVAASAMVVTTVALVVPSLFALPDHLPSFTTMAALLILGVICTGMTLVLFYTLIAQTGPARAALAFYLSPAFAVVFGAVFLRERLTLATVAGLAAIAVGSGLAAGRMDVAS